MICELTFGPPVRRISLHHSDHTLCTMSPVACPRGIFRTLVSHPLKFRRICCLQSSSKQRQHVLCALSFIETQAHRAGHGTPGALHDRQIVKSFDRVVFSSPSLHSIHVVAPLLV
jgi:hypothetical protein